VSDVPFKREGAGFANASLVERNGLKYVCKLVTEVNADGIRNNFIDRD